jgi:ribosomal protein L11 methyltransferase
VDIDPESVRNARENAEKNDIGDEFIIGHGSVTEVLEEKFPLKQAPLVVANILAPIIIRLFDAGLVELIEPGGEIILSGILQEQAQNVIAAGQARGLELNEQRKMGDWVALSLSRSKEKCPRGTIISLLENVRISLIRLIRPSKEKKNEQ